MSEITTSVEKPTSLVNFGDLLRDKRHGAPLGNGNANGQHVEGFIFGPNKILPRVISDEAQSIIEASLGAKLAEFEDFKRENPNLTLDDKRDILLALALRHTNREIYELVKANHELRELPEVIKSSVYPVITQYRARYQDQIDEIYVTCVVRIGEIYSFADKLSRVGRYNEMATALEPIVMRDMRSADNWDKDKKEKAGIYLKILNQINIEMGSKPFGEMFKKLLPGERGVNGDTDTPTPEKEDVMAILNDRWKNQLPDANISSEVSFSDYSNCANGEKLATGVVICYNAKMTDDNLGAQCSVQLGKCVKCPKFLNNSLLNNQEWLTTTRKNGITARVISELCGSTEWATDQRDRILFFLRKFGIQQFNRKPKVEKIPVVPSMAEEALKLQERNIVGTGNEDFEEMQDDFSEEELISNDPQERAT